MAKAVEAEDAPFETKEYDVSCECSIAFIQR